MAIVKFNRQYTSAQLKAAKDTSSIAGETNNVVNGTLYIASDGDGIYVGNSASPSILKLLGQVDTTLTAAQIISKLSDYMVVDPDTGEIDPTTVVPGADQAISAAYAASAGKATYDEDNNRIKNTYATKAEIQALDATVDKDASSSTAAIATNTDVSSANAAIAVATGYTVVQADGALVPNSSSIDSGRADKFGAANAALVQAKSYADTKKSEVIGTSGDASSASTIYGAKAYADSLITGLGTILTFKDVIATEAALKAQTNQNKGWVYIVSADHSEWVCTDNIGSTADPSKWEKFGTTDVQGALYKNTTGTFASGGLVYANGTNGATNTIGSYDGSTLDLSNTDIVLGNVAVNGQTSFSDNITVSDVASVTIMGSTILQGPTKIDSVEGSGTFQTNTIQSLETDGSGYEAIVISPVDTNGTVTIGSDSITPILFAASDAYIQDPNYQNHKILHAGDQTLTAAEKTQVLTNIGAQAAGSYKTTQSAVTPAAGTTDGAAGGQYVEQVTQNANGVITVTRKKLPDFQGSGSAGTSGGSWKNPLVYTSLSASRVLSGSAGTIPAATTSNDGYMTSAQVSNLNNAILALTWEGESA